jgi:hypothetical protein
MNLTFAFLRVVNAPRMLFSICMILTSKVFSSNTRNIRNLFTADGSLHFRRHVTIAQLLEQQ